MKYRFALAAMALTAAQPALADDRKDWATASDIGVASLSILAIGLPLAKHDKPGAAQAGEAIAASSLITFVMKETIPETRPDGSDRKSFPSGHTSTAFAAATTLFKREGQGVGIPALAVAGFVGLARVQAGKHHWHDVLVGAGIGTAAGLLITHAKPGQKSALIPWGDAHGGGITLVARF